MRKFVLSLGLLFFGWSSGAGATPVEWTTASGGNGHLYKVSFVHMTSWHTARSAALAMGSGWDLASITSQAEQDFIISLLPANPFHHKQFWLGGYDSVTEGDWEWSDGSPFAYTNWWSHEPNDYWHGEDYMTMDYRKGGLFHHLPGEWKWNDLSGHPSAFVKGYISEFSDPIPEPSTGLLVASGLIGLGLKRHQNWNRSGPSRVKR